MAASARPYQVVVWGATGFTGRLVCEHLVRSYADKDVRWAMAGRNKERLEQVKDSLSRINPDATKGLQYIVANVSDAATLRAMAAQTQVIISTAGPFAKFGTPVVEAALEEGTHYCDITGEVLWVRRMVEAYHERAKAAGVRLVHCCGFDSIPSDLGTLLVVDHCQKVLNKGVSEVNGLLWPDYTKLGGVSGGTLASGANQLATESKAEISKAFTDAYYLVPSGPRGSDSPTPFSAAYNKWAKRWTAPFIMEGCNGRVVHRSAALAARPYGSDFKYREAAATTLGALEAYISTGALAVFAALFSVSWTRRLLMKALPAPGEGPSRDVMMSSTWGYKMFALTEAASGEEPQVVAARVSHEHGDAGYWSTSRMVLEAGLCLATQLDECAAGGAARGGVLTPASAMGMVLVERLRRAGYRFEVLQSPALSSAPQAEARPVEAPGGKQRAPAQLATEE